MEYEYESMEKQPRESNVSYDKRIDYMLMGENRSIKKLVLKREKIQETDPNFQKIYAAYRKLSSKWNWDFYAHLYDVERQTRKIQERETKFGELEDIELKMLEALIKSLHNFIAEFVKNPVKSSGEEYSSLSKVDLYNKILSAFDKADILLRRLTGQPTEYSKTENTGAIDVKATVMDTKTLEQKEKEDREIVEQFISRKIKEIGRSSSSVEENSSQ